MSIDYNKTLQLPKTDFPMRAGLPDKEPKMLEDWDNVGLYYKMIENTKGRPLYAFHDGPPYANAAIHLGTALNKVLKDIIVRQKNMSGKHVPYIPGWDTHGLPIELRAMKEYGLHLGDNPIELRERCHEFALQNVETQKKQFKRLGSLADYDDPYLTLRRDYESKQVDIFGIMANKGYIYRDLKIVHWCPECVTALAEAEIEYSDDDVDSIYVKFKVSEDKNAVLQKLGIESVENTYIVIWTTTTWTLPANLAAAVGPSFEYVAVSVNGENLIMAKQRVEEVMQAAGLTDYTVSDCVSGQDLEFLTYHHPFLDRISPVIVGDHVTVESGTGVVHTAPGHGVDDFDIVTKKYPELGIVVPVDANGQMTKEAGGFINGLKTFKANKIILEKLKETNNLFAISHIKHQYPHCWRCNSPIIFRATEQWFCSVEDFKDEAVEAIGKVNFIPTWGQQRLASMVSDRNAWCISRQRVWGMPIPIFYCNDCGKYIVNEETIKAVSEKFAKEGSDSWFKYSAKEILPEAFTCTYCNGSDFTKETDTMDVWFDSGCSYAAALEPRENYVHPVDLYLEGADQYRGWFQSSLLTSVAWRGTAPYKNVLTHGMVVDGQGKKMSKSVGNGVDPIELTEKYGADILRLWVASSDYKGDVRISDEIIKQLSEAYRKIRNTARFMLSNLSDFNPDSDKVDNNDFTSIDKWAYSKYNTLLSDVMIAYETFDFHVVYHSIINFCTIDMSNFYLDIIKDRLYVEKAEGILRRAAQTVMYEILRGVTLMISPILCFTAEEIWSYMTHSQSDNEKYAVLNNIPNIGETQSKEFMDKWAVISNIRDIVNKAIEEARAAKIIGKSLEAKVTLYADDKIYATIKDDLELLKMVFIVSDAEIVNGKNPNLSENEDMVSNDISVVVTTAIGDKCERCWTISQTVGTDTKHPTLCERCARIVG